MEYTVLLENRNGSFRAIVPILPDCVTEGRTREEALGNVQAAIAQRLRRLEVARVKVETPGERDPWEPFIGIWAEDSTWDDFQAQIVAYRQQCDEESARG